MAITADRRLLQALKLTQSRPSLIAVINVDGDEVSHVIASFNVAGLSRSQLGMTLANIVARQSALTPKARATRKPTAPAKRSRAVRKSA
jgi:hypothetical protein